MSEKLLPERLCAQLVALPRRKKQLLMLVSDVALLFLAVIVAYKMRLGFTFSPSISQLLVMLAAPVIAVPIFARIGLYRSVIRYVGEQVLWTVMKGMSMAALLWAVLAFMTHMTGGSGVPRTVPLLYWLLGGVLVGSSRFAARWLLWAPLRDRFAGRQVLIYGAGEAGRQLAASLRLGHEFFPAGFLDDNRTLHGKDVAGLRVYPPNVLDKLVEKFDIRDVIVTMPSASAARRRAVVEFLEQHAVKVRILPAMVDIASGRHLVNLVREVEISDLLGREAVAPLPNLLSQSIASKVVMVTGAGGSIGSELCRQIAIQRPAKLVMLDLSEHALYQIEREISPLLLTAPVACLGSILDRGLLHRLMVSHSINTVYHAAAYKHVPIVESNVSEGVRNNVFGTQAVAEVALDAGVETFVLISSDKAVRPTSVMGATKRWAEMIVLGCARRARERRTGQHFCVVRFGNVLGSSGSVIPLFKEQIQKGGPVTVTHPDVTRYFMSIHEAVELVIQAGSMAGGGEIFLLDMGEPVKILTLAKNMIRLAGHTVCDDTHPIGGVEILMTGLRPGEKLYEELLVNQCNAIGTEHPKIMRAIDPLISADQLERLLVQLSDALGSDELRIRTLLLQVAMEGAQSGVSNSGLGNLVEIRLSKA